VDLRKRKEFASFIGKPFFFSKRREGLQYGQSFWRGGFSTGGSASRFPQFSMGGFTPKGGWLEKHMVAVHQGLLLKDHLPFHVVIFINGFILKIVR